jgi:hypothetical protein
VESGNPNHSYFFFHVHRLNPATVTSFL